MRLKEKLTSKTALIVYWFISVLVVVIIAFSLPAIGAINKSLRNIDLPLLGPNSTSFIISILANIITASFSFLFIKIIFNKKYLEFYAKYYPSTQEKTFNIITSILKDKFIKNLFISDQNLHCITQNPEAEDSKYEKLIFDLLENGTNIYLFLCEENNKKSIDTWTSASGNMYTIHLKKSHEILQSWKTKYRKNPTKGKLLLLTAPFVSLNVIAFNFMNDVSNGKIMIIPYFYSPDFDSRPIFVLDSYYNHGKFIKYSSIIKQIIGKGYEGIKEI